MLGAHTTRVVLSGPDGATLAGHPQPRQWSALQWSRSVNETSTAEGTITTTDPTLPARLRAMYHTLSIVRGGEPVWTGPVYITTATGRTLRLEARDPTVMFAKRRIRYEMTWTERDVSYIAADILRAEMADDPFRVVTGMVVAPMGAGNYHTYRVAADTVTVADALGDLVDAGLEWTYCAGRLYIGPVHRDNRTPPVRDMDLASPLAVQQDGSEICTDMLTLGRGVRGSYADRSAPIRFDAVQSVDSATSEGACIDLSRRAVKLRGVAPVKVVPGSARLLATSPIEMPDLIPGVGVPIASRLLDDVDAVMRLTGIEVDAVEDAISITVDTMPRDLEPQELSAPETGYRVATTEEVTSVGSIQ